MAGAVFRLEKQMFFNSLATDGTSCPLCLFPADLLAGPRDETLADKSVDSSQNKVACDDISQHLGDRQNQDPGQN